MYNILLDNKIIAMTPKHLGVNVEVQDHHDRCNLWDWLADSGATLLREFHPEHNLRKAPAEITDYACAVSPETFDIWRRTLIVDPERQFPWQNYRFAEAVPWLGVPDGIAGKIKSSELNAVLSMGYATKSFPRPLVTDWNSDDPLAANQVDWAAAACAYEYYLGMIYRYSSHYAVTRFMLHNEPENHPERFHLPPEESSSEENDRRKIHALAAQLGVMAFLARLAMEDVRGLLSDRHVAEGLSLSAPGAHWHWEIFAQHMQAYVDVLDYHHYGPQPETFRRTYERLAIRARQYHKKTAISEFNLLSGPICPSDMLFNLEPALKLASLIMSVLSVARPEDPLCEFATLYHFQFPATHRNYKSLVYGDMNMVDWSGRDTPWMKLNHPALYPDFEALQLRHPTLGYFIFRMFARCVPGEHSDRDSHAVLDWGCAIAAAELPVEVLAIQTDKNLIVNLLNFSSEPIKNVSVNRELLSNEYRFAVIRETSSRHRDAAVAQQRLTGKNVTLDLPAQSLTQLIFTPLELDAISNLHVEEHSYTPGSLQNLNVLQTTRLRAVGRINDRDVDLTDLNVVWSSSQSEELMVYPGGLLQRLKHSSRAIVIEAKTLDGHSAPTLRIEPV